MPLTTIGTTAGYLPTGNDTPGTAVPVRSHILVRAGSGNTGTVGLGFASTVTINGTAGTDGMPLYAGDVRKVSKAQAEDANDVWIIGTASGQKVYWEVN